MKKAIFGYFRAIFLENMLGIALLNERNEVENEIEQIVKIFDHICENWQNIIQMFKVQMR